MSKTRDVKPVSFSFRDTEEKKLWEYVQDKTFSSYVKQLICQDMWRVQSSTNLATQVVTEPIELEEELKPLPEFKPKKQQFKEVSFDPSSLL